MKPSRPITIRLSEDQIAMLETIRSSGLFGRTINDTAERLLSDAIAKRLHRTLSALGIKP